MTTFRFQNHVDAYLATLLSSPGPLMVTFEPCEPLTIPPGILPLLDEVRCGGMAADDGNLRAWPSHPANIAAIETQCREAGVRYTFTGWGRFEPYDPVKHASEEFAHDIDLSGASGASRIADGNPDNLQWMIRTGNAGRDGSVLFDKPE